jgi:hypothetical protein
VVDVRFTRVGIDVVVDFHEPLLCVQRC